MRYRVWIVALVISALCACGGDEDKTPATIGVIGASKDVVKGGDGQSSDGNDGNDSSSGNDSNSGNDSSSGNDGITPDVSQPGDITTGSDAQGSEDIVQDGAHLEALPQSIHFGTTQLAVPVATQFTLRNNGTESVNVTAMKFSEESGEAFTFTNEAPLGLMVPGEQRQVDLTFKSNKIGSHTSTLSIETLPVLDAPLTVSLAAIVSVAPSSTVIELSSTAASLKFGAVKVGTQKSVKFSLVNSGTQPLQVVSIEMASQSSPDFSFKSDQQIPTLLGQGGTVEMTVTYSPDAVESDTGILHVVNSSPNTPVVKIPMTGSGYADACSGALECSPAPMNFGSVPLGQAKSVTLVCTNTGVGPIKVNGVKVELSANDGFSWTSPPTETLPIEVGNNEAVAIPVLFSPQDTSSKNGTVTITSDDCKAPTQAVNVTATGVTPKTAPPCLPAGQFEPKVEWEWTPEDVKKDASMVFMAPIVVNLDDDNGDSVIDGEDIPEVVFVAHSGGLPALFNNDKPGVLRAIHGKDGSPMWVNADEKHQPGWATNLASAEIDGKPGPEIIAIGYQPSPEGKNCPGVPDQLPAPFCSKYVEGHLLAYHGADGGLFWKSDPWTGATTDLENMGAPTVADLNGDGIAEVILGNHVFNGIDGSLIWVGSAGRGNDSHGYLSIVADVNGDGKLNVIAGNTAYNPDGTVLWTAAMGDTHGTAAADVDADGDIEVYINGPNGDSVLVDGKSGKIVAGPVYTGIISCCVAAPAVADIDASKPGLEIMTVGDDELKVLDANLNILWSKAIKDSTGAAGPTAFDVEGDGIAEVIYADMSKLWVLRGSDGTVIFEADRSSATGLDNPVIADVDGDNHAEILVPMETPFGGPGLRLYSNKDDSWVATRRIWNQHAYSAVNIYDNASVPAGKMAEGVGPLLLRTNVPTCQK